MKLLGALNLKLGARDLHGDMHQYNTRKQNKLSIPSHRLAILCKKPQYAGIKYY